jgi:hypothetical protein
MPNKRIRVRMKGATKYLVTDPMDADEADRLLREEVLPKIGRIGSIGLPGLAINASEAISAQSYEADTQARILH